MAQILKDVEVRFGLTVKVTEAVAPGSSGLAEEIPRAAALHNMVVALVFTQPAGTFFTVNCAPS